MPTQTCTGGMMICTMGLAPASFVATPRTAVTSAVMAGNIMDAAPMVNIQPFGACISLLNPTVAAATAAALGVLTPTPCIPNTMPPWTTGSPDVIVCGAPALDDTGTLTCMWGGLITFTQAGQMQHQIP